MKKNIKRIGIAAASCAVIAGATVGTIALVKKLKQDKADDDFEDFDDDWDDSIFDDDDDLIENESVDITESDKTDVNDETEDEDIPIIETPVVDKVIKNTKKTTKKIVPTEENNKDITVDPFEDDIK